MNITTIQKIESIPVLKTVQNETKWNVEWYTLTGDLKWGGSVGSSVFPSTFKYMWGQGNVYASYKDYIGFIAYAEIHAPRSGIFNFTLGSDDGIRLFIDGEEMLSNQYEYGGSYSTTPGSINLSKGKHFLKLEYWEKHMNAGVYFNCDPELLTWNEDQEAWEYKTIVSQETTYVDTIENQIVKRPLYKILTRQDSR